MTWCSVKDTCVLKGRNGTNQARYSIHTCLSLLCCLTWLCTLQVAAADLGIPLSSVYIAETATDKVPNSSPTAASASSDMYGSATADACAQLNARLKPYREKRADSTFTQLVNAAYLDRVDLSAHGFYATPDITGKSGAPVICVAIYHLHMPV